MGGLCYTLEVIDIEERKIVYSKDSVTDFKISPDSKILVCSQYNSNYKYDSEMVYNLSNGEFLWSHNMNVAAQWKISPDSKVIVMKNEDDEKLYVFDLKDGNLRWKSSLKLTTLV